MSRTVFAGLMLALLSSVTSAHNSFPSDVHRCVYSDTECLAATMTQILQTHFKNGHRGLNLIPFDPLHIKSLTLERLSGSPVNVEFTFKDVDLTGLSQISVSKLSGLTKEVPHVFQIVASIPKLTLDGPYKVDGKVLILPIVGEGNSNLVFEDTTAIAKLKCESVEKDGKMYLKIVKTHLDLTPQNVKFNFENLFNGDMVLGKSMNKFLNENWKELYSTLKNTIAEPIGIIIQQIANQVFLQFPYNDLFLPS